MASLVNFRCPDDMLAEIERIGKTRHKTAIRHHRSSRDYDLTATMLEIVAAGIASIDDGYEIPNKTRDNTAFDAIERLRSEILGKFEAIESRLMALENLPAVSDGDAEPVNYFPDVLEAEDTTEKKLGSAA